VWHSALDSGDSRRYGRPKVARYVPEGTVWRNRDGTGEAEAVLPGGGRVAFKSADQGRDGFQGASVRCIGNDEEPPREVVSEQMMRVADQPEGRVLHAMTPLMGWTALLEEFVRDPAADVVVRWLHGSDNPHVPADRLARILAKYGAHERLARERGEIVALEGRIYTDWRRDLHVIAPRRLPEEWPRYAAVDFGTRNPTAVLWAALDERDDVLHVYRGHYEREKPQEWHVAVFVRRTTDAERERMEWIVADPAGKAERLTWLQCDVATVPAFKHAGSVREQINAVATRLAPDAEGRPHLVVHDVPDLAMLVREIESYVWKPRASGAGDLPDEPLKKGDHFMDALAYLCLRLQRTRGQIERDAEEAA
jgi:phage terminase large subunit-like protein